MKSKYLKHFLSMMTLPFIAATGMPTDIKKKAVKRPELKFGADGKFRILHITDIHEVDPEMDDDEDRAIPRDKCVEALNVIEKSIERTNPDLVVFGGDNINGYWEEFDYEYIRKTIEKITEPVRRRNLPLAIVFGNHDSEIMSNFREFQMMLYLQYENFLGCFNAEEMYGCGNYNVKIKSSDGKKDAYNLWFVDSNDYPYDENGKRLEDNEDMSDEQIAWLDARLYDAEKTGLPVFIFNHYAFNNTMQIEKIWPEGELGERSDELRALLQKHKDLKIFFITGHIHNYFGVNKIETDGNIIMLDVPSYGKENFSFENGYDKPTEHPELGIGYQMEVYDNRVEFKAVDFNRGKWHKEFDLEIDI